MHRQDAYATKHDLPLSQILLIFVQNRGEAVAPNRKYSYWWHTDFGILRAFSPYPFPRNSPHNLRFVGKLGLFRCLGSMYVLS